MRTSEDLVRFYAAESTVRRLYRELLLREPKPDDGEYDAGGLGNYVGALLYHGKDEAWLRQVLMDSDEYKEKHPPEPPLPDHPDPLRGWLQLGASFRDDGGPVNPVLCHAGDLLPLTDAGRAALRSMRRVGYHGVRAWTGRAGEWWRNLGRELLADDPQYWPWVREFARELRALDLRWLVSQGDLMRMYPTDEGRRAFMRQLATVLADEGGLSLVCGVDGGNEAWQNGEPDPARLRTAVDAFREVLPVPVWSLTSPEMQYSVPGETEDQAKQRIRGEIDAMAGSVFDVHDWRHGHIWEKLPRAFSLVYGMDLAQRLGIASEWTGPGPLVSVTEHQEALTAHAMCMMAALCLLRRTAFVYFSSPGVSLREAGEFERMAGFSEVPEMARHLPRDLMAFGTLCHGGDRFRGTRVLAVAEAGSRCEHAISDDGRFVAVAYADHGGCRFPVERAFDGGVAGEEPAYHHAGEQWTLRQVPGDIITGRLA